MGFVIIISIIGVIWLIVQHVDKKGRPERLAKLKLEQDAKNCLKR